MAIPAREAMLSRYSFSSSLKYLPVDPLPENDNSVELPLALQGNDQHRIHGNNRFQRRVSAYLTNKLTEGVTLVVFFQQSYYIRIGRDFILTRMVQLETLVVPVENIYFVVNALL